MRTNVVIYVLICALIVQAGQSVIINISNYGYVLSKRHELQLTTASVKLLFHTTLPYRLPTVRIEPVNCSTLEAVQLVSHCSRICHIIAAYQASKERLARHVKTLLDHIHDIFQDLPIRRVTKRGFLTDALGKFWRRRISYIL